MLRRAEKRQSEKLTDEDSDEEWAGKISIGTPAQSAFLIDFDSKSLLLLQDRPLTISIFCSRLVRSLAALIDLH
jgi:hypothetical protein